MSSYDFVPTSMKQFVCVLQTLYNLHQKDFVHVMWDWPTLYLINKPVIWLILTQQILLVNRTLLGIVSSGWKASTSCTKRKEGKNSWSILMQYIIKVCIDGPDPLILEELIDMEVSLLDIIAKLSNLVILSLGLALNSILFIFSTVLFSHTPCAFYYVFPHFAFPRGLVIHISSKSVILSLNSMLPFQLFCSHMLLVLLNIMYLHFL